MQTENVLCDLCGSPDSKLDFITADNTDFLPGSFRVVRCRACGFSYLNPRIFGDAASLCYEDEYYAKDSGARFNALVEIIIRWFRRGRIRCLNRFVRKGRLLDIGSDRGFFLSLLKKQGWEVYGTQLSLNAAESARKRYGIDLQVADLLSCKFPSDHFDAVVLWHVLEHLKAPALYLKEINRILKPGGVFLLEVPDAGSLQSRFFRNRWLICEAPRHLYFFDRAHLSKLLENNNIGILDVGHFSLEIGPFTMLQSLLNIIFSNDNYLFNLAKSRCVSKFKRKGTVYTVIYLWVATVLAPASFLLSFLLSLSGSGEVLRISGIKK